MGLFLNSAYDPPFEELTGPEEFTDQVLEELLRELEAYSEVDPEENEDYISRDDKVMSLLREKEIRQTAHPQTEFFELLRSASVLAKRFEAKALLSYLCKIITAKVTVPALIAVADHLEETGDVLAVTAELRRLFGEVMPSVDLKLDCTNQYILDYLTKRKGVRALLLKGIKKDRVLMLDSKLKKSQRDRGLSIRGQFDYRYFTDAEGISESAFFVLIDEVFQDHILKLDAEALMQNVVYRTMYEYFLENLLPYRNQEYVFIKSSVFAAYPDIHSILDKTEFQWYLVPDNLSQEAAKEWCDAYPISETDLWLCLPFIKTIPRSYMMESPSFRRSEYIKVYVKLFLLLYDEWNTRRQTWRYLKELSGQSARVFETKKNIPEKYQRAMKESIFNEYFRYVEIDSDCDLSLIREIEKEFVALNQSCFDSRSFTSDLRFRKLGRHHASGLYYPNKKFLCVDIRTPSSMCHEYLHMLDYSEGKISEQYAFYAVRKAYEAAIRKYMESLPDGSPTKKRLKGNTIYNLAYYLEPTEIFAYCGELYLTRVVGVNNSLLKPEDNFAYPSNDVLMEAVKAYYSNLFPKTVELVAERRKAGAMLPAG